MLCREIRVGGWSFFIQVLPEVKFLDSIAVFPREKRLELFQAQQLAIQLLND